jgi:hypothetical protein
MNVELTHNINSLYNVFKPYTILGNLRDRSCDCCVNDEEIKTLLSKPLRVLSTDDIYHFMTSAMTTFGDIVDYKHFLPRIFELMIESDDVMDDFLTFEKLNYAKWLEWPKNEVDAIQSFINTFLIFSLGQGQSKINSAIDLHLTYGDFKTLSSILTNSNSKVLLLTIVDHALNSYFYNAEEALDQLFSNKAILQKLEALYFKTTDTELANSISIAYTILEQNHKNNELYE